MLASFSIKVDKLLSFAILSIISYMSLDDSSSSFVFLVEDSVFSLTKRSLYDVKRFDISASILSVKMFEI